MTTQRAIWILEVSLSMPFYFRWELPSYIYPAYTYFVTTFLIFWSIVFENGRHLFYLESSNITSLKIDKLKVINANILRRIESAMKIDKLFLEQNLTVKKLSKRISIPEHKIRSSIHSELEFRNFSQFLNHYRILESTKELVNTEKPISTIGMDVGYSSLSTFYKVFKDINSVTPKEYRAINKTIN
jgi:AraC-like DNA-binding protein